VLGSGEAEAGGRRKASILADTLEALLGAVYLDGGIESARRVVLAHWAPLIADQMAAPGERDYKTRLQELLAQGGQTPSYMAEGEGPEHARVFFATVAAGGRVLGMGMGTSKKRAEQAAARQALDTLEAEGERGA
jgi:ribonuclease-3